MKSFKQILLSAVFIFVGSVALACPVALDQNPIHATQGMTLCQAFDRYHKAVSQLQAQGIAQARRVGNLMAPRFINMPDWLAKRTPDADSAVKIYAPAPTTWQEWEEAAAVIDGQANENFKSRRIAKIDLDWLVRLHKRALNGLLDSVGVLRQLNSVGPQVFRAKSLTEEQVHGVASLDYMQIKNPGQHLVTFRPVHCFEDEDKVSQEQAASDMKLHHSYNAGAWPRIPDSEFFVGADGQRRQCGFLSYGPPDEIPAQVGQYIEYVNGATTSWQTSHFDNNPLQVAAKAQRWWITIHPFYDGNGRMSRYVMDLLLESLGLPAPLLSDMNNDMFTSEAEWTLEIGRGIERAVLAAEQCAADPKAVGCVEIASPAGASK